MLKRIILSFLFLITFPSVYSQFTIQPLIISPTGIYGVYLNKSPGFRFGRLYDFENRWRIRLLGSLAYFIPRKNTFNVAGVEESYIVTVHSGTKSIKLFANIEFSSGMDIKIVEKGLFSWYAGFDVPIGGNLSRIEVNIPGIVNSGETLTSIYVGFRGRTGIEFELEDHILFLEIDRTYSMGAENFVLNYNTLGIGITF